MRVTTIVASLAIALAAMLGLSACSSPAVPDGKSVIAPVSMEANDLQGKTIDLVVGQVLNINTGDLKTDSYSGSVADGKVATFSAGSAKEGLVLNPGVEGVSVGETAVTMTNTNGGIQPLEFTVKVSERAS